MKAQYSYLSTIKSPKIIAEGWRLFGTQEIKGEKHNPVILSWAKEVGLEKVYKADEVAWCGLYVAVVVQRAGFEPVKDPLWAKNWLKYGIKQKEAMLGDVLVFNRAGGGGHVGFYVGENKNYYYVLGGNQSDTVNIMMLAKTRCVGIRRTVWKVSQPEAVKKYFIDTSGEVSTNEA